MENEMNEELRNKIIFYMMTKHQQEFTWMPTWWFKFSIKEQTKVIRKELNKMEKEGIVVSDRQWSNNTMWRLAN